MRPLIRRIVRNLEPPDEALLAQARQTLPTRTEHERFLHRIEALHALEYYPPPRPAPWTGRLRLAAFNTERLKDRAAVRRLIDQAGADAVLLSEVDVGMARSGNVHTVRELIEPAGEGYLYGVEFVELDLGSAEEMRWHAGERNACGFHGNAIATRFELENPHLIPLDESGFWFPGRRGAQRRIGGRMALAARVAGAPRPFWIVSVHLESKTDPADRQGQIQNLLRALDGLAPDEACVIGGDFNAKGLPRGEGERQLLLDAPEPYEPLFADLRRAGFSWACSNIACPTQRAGPSNKHKPPFSKLDWIVVRGLTAQNPQVIPAVDERGQDVSDHEMLVVDLAF